MRGGKLTGLECLGLLCGGDRGSSKLGGLFTGFPLVEPPTLLNLLAMLVIRKSLSDMCVRAEEKEFVVSTGFSVLSGGGVEVY